MSKLDIIRASYELLPSDALNGMLKYGNQEMSLSSFMENFLIDAITEQTTPEKVADIVINKFIPKVNYKQISGEEVILDFINSIPDFIENIQTGPESFINVREYMLGFKDYITSDNKVVFGPKTIDLADLYYKILQNEYHAPTMVDKIELCEYYIEEIRNTNPNLLQTQLSEGNKTISFEEYLHDVLPNKMADATKVEVDDKLVSIDEYIKDLIQKQRIVTEYHGGVPNLVPEIPKEPEQIVDYTDLSVATALKQSDTAFYTQQLNNLMQLISTCTKLHDLENLKKSFNRLIPDIISIDVDDSLTKQIENIKNLLDVKEKNILKIYANKDEFIELYGKELDYIARYESATLDDCNLMFGRIISMETDVLNFGIMTPSLENKFKKIKNAIALKRIGLRELPKENKQFDENLDNLESMARDIALELNNLMHLEADEREKTFLALDYRIDSLATNLEASYQNGRIDQMEYECLCDQVSDFKTVISNSYKNVR